MLCPDCGGRDAHKPDCLSVRVARGEITPREAQVRRLQSAIPCPECGRGSPIGTHDCQAVPVCRISDDGHEFPLVDHIYVEGYDRCIECGEPAPVPHVGVDFGGVGGDRPSSVVVDEFTGLKNKLAAGESWSGEFMRNAEEMHKKLGVSAEKATEAMQHIGHLCGIPVGTSPHVPEGSIYVIDGNSGRDPEHWIGSASRVGDEVESFRLAGHDPESMFVHPRTWRNGVVSVDGRPIGKVTSFDVT